MLNSNEWWGMILDYNQTIFPVQLIAMAIAVALCIYMLIGDKDKGSLFAKIYLAVCNLLVGIGFFMLLGTELPAKMRNAQGVLFIVIAILFIVDIFTKKSTIKIPNRGAMRTITIIWLLIIMLYPVVGLTLGRDMYSIIYPGTLPCATTAFALVLLCGNIKNVNKWIFIPLLIWAIPFPPLVQIPKYHVYEDGIMFAAGIYSVVILALYFAKKMKNKKKVN